MKIVFVGNGLLDTDCYPTPNQGGSVQTWGLAKELAKRGHDVYIIRRGNTEGKDIINRVNLVTIKFKGIENMIRARFMSFPYHATRIFSSLYFSEKSTKVIQRISPDIVCLIDRFSGIFPSRVNIPKIYVMHVPEALDFFRPYAVYANKLNSVMFYIKKVTENSIMSKADKVIVLNSYIEKYLRKKGLNNIAKIPNGIELEEFTDDGNEGDDNYVLYGGRFDWNKNVTSLISAFAEVQKSHSDYNLFLVGAGPEEGKIRSLINRKNLQPYVKIIPWLPRMDFINLIKKCSLFVLPSIFEVFPVAVLEAMASGKPVIARSNMGTSEVITHADNGFLYNYGGQLVEYLELLLGGPKMRKEMGWNARETVKKRFALSKIAEEYLNLYREILEEDARLTYEVG